MADIGKEKSVGEQGNDIPIWALSLHNKLDKMMVDMDAMKTSLNTMSSEISMLKHKSEVSETRIYDIEGAQEDMRFENQVINKKVDTLLGRVLRLENKQRIDHEQILDVQCRSMRDNIIFTEIPGDERDETPDQVEERVYEYISSKCGIENPKQHINIVRAHRMGIKSSYKPRTVVARFLTSKDKDKIMRQKKSNSNLKFFDQFPEEIRERRRQLAPVLVKARERNAKAKFAVDKLIINGNLHRNAYIPRIPESSKIFEKDSDIQETDIISSSSKVIRGNSFQGHIINVYSPTDVRNALDQFHSDSQKATATHSSFAFRISEEMDQHIERYDDDGEYGAGERILNQMRIKGINNKLLIVTRWASHEKLGIARFSAIEEVCQDAIHVMSQLS